jgi:hypothetical protein
MCPLFCHQPSSAIIIIIIMAIVTAAASFGSGTQAQLQTTVYGIYNGVF